MERSQQMPQDFRLSTAGRTLFSSDTLRISKASPPVFLYTFSVFLSFFLSFYTPRFPLSREKKETFVQLLQFYRKSPFHITTCTSRYFLFFPLFVEKDPLSLCTEYGNFKTKISPFVVCVFGSGGGGGGEGRNITWNIICKLKFFHLHDPRLPPYAFSSDVVW